MFTFVGLFQRPACGGERRLDPGHAAVAVDRGDQAGLFAADVAAGAAEHVRCRSPAAAEDVLPEEALLVRLLDGLLHARERERVLVADVDVALVGVPAPGRR